MILTLLSAKMSKWGTHKQHRIKNIPTSVTTFYSPIMEVEEMVRRSSTPRLGNPRHTLNMESLTDDDWLSLITSCDEPKVNLIRCWYCGIWSRNLAAHIKINHRKNRQFGLGFSGLNSQRRMFADKETFEANIMSKRSIWVSKPQSRAKLMLTTYNT